MLSSDIQLAEFINAAPKWLCMCVYVHSHLQIVASSVSWKYCGQNKLIIQIKPWKHAPII